MLTATLNAVWEALARLQLDGETPSLRDIQIEARVSLSSVSVALKKLENEGIIFLGREVDGSQKDRAITLHIWPATFGIGANTGKRQSAADEYVEKFIRGEIKFGPEIHLDYFKD